MSQEKIYKKAKEKCREMSNEKQESYPQGKEKIIPSKMADVITARETKRVLPLSSLPKKKLL